MRYAAKLRRFGAALVSTLVVLLGVPFAAAQGYPAKSIRFIVPFAPGGNTDVQGRLIGQKLSEIWGQQVVIDNRPGAGGTLGVELASRAAPDGYTIVLASFGNILVGPSLYKKLGYDPVKDLAPVVLVSTPPGLMTVHPSLPVKSVGELIAYAQANAGKLNYASSGNGTWNHLFAEQFKVAAKIQMTHVPYKGAGPAVTDLIGGHVHVMFAPFPTAMPQVKSGRLRALAVTSVRRSPLLPEVPSVSESGLPGYEAASWFAVLAPPGTPTAILRKLNAAINQVLARPDVREAFASDGSEPVGGTPEDLARSIREGMAKWGKLVHDLGIKL